MTIGANQPLSGSFALRLTKLSISNILIEYGNILG
jgi:hypothetical protein